MDTIKRLFNAAGRAWLYGIAAAAVGLLVMYGVISADQAPLWLALISAVLWALGNVTAIINTDSTGRAALYGIALAVVTLLTGYRIITAEQANAWALLAAAAFGVGTNVLAFTKVTPEAKDDPDFAPGEPLAEEEVQPEGQDPESIPPAEDEVFD